jgi:Zn-dependent M16 (insulinase) family peptidase
MRLQWRSLAHTEAHTPSLTNHKLWNTRRETSGAYGCCFAPQTGRGSSHQYRNAVGHLKQANADPKDLFAGS